MEEPPCALLFIIIVVVVIVIHFVNESKKINIKKDQDNWRNSQSQTNHQNNRGTSYTTTTSRPNTLPTNKNTYHPLSGTSPRPTIRFVNITDNQISQNMPRVEDLHDALTGAPLNPNLHLYQCANCKVFYHSDSYDVLKEINNGACVSCQSISISAITKTAPSKFGQEFKPSVVTLGNFRDFVGQVVTFEGFAYEVAESRRGNDFAILFENKGWVRSFKLVFFRQNITAMGGRGFINTLENKIIKVRGLIVKDPTFGYEIVVSQRGMILEVSS